MSQVRMSWIMQIGLLQRCNKILNRIDLSTVTPTNICTSRPQLGNFIKLLLLLLICFIKTWDWTSIAHEKNSKYINEGLNLIGFCYAICALYISLLYGNHIIRIFHYLKFLSPYTHELQHPGVTCSLAIPNTTPSVLGDSHFIIWFIRFIGKRCFLYTKINTIIKEFIGFARILLKDM